jgi:hypothetical protein
MKPGIDDNVQAIGRAVRVLLVGTLLAIGLAQSTRAQTVYTYTGNLFTTFGLPYSCVLPLGECQVTGSFTVPTPLAANLAYGSITPSSYSFTDGTNTRATTIPGDFAAIFKIATDSVGNINQWYIYLYSVDGLQGIVTYDITAGNEDSTFGNHGSAGLAYEQSNPGAWVTTTTGVTTTPEPSTALLYLTGLLALVGAALVKRLG